MSDLPRQDRKSLLYQAWPYLFFLLFVTFYNFFFLGLGFNATDEGYLLSLGARVADGEMPYVDFYFLRPPLSIYIQAALINLLGESYTVLASRIYWTVQMCMVALLLSIVYRRFVSKGELLLLLLATFTISTLLIGFPWYSYDGLFFAVVTVVLFDKRQFVLSGVAAFLAFMTKQNYLLLLPLFFAVAVLVQWRWKELKVVSFREVFQMSLGFAVPACIYLGYVYLNSGLLSFWENVFVFPRKASMVSLSFSLFQNHPEAFSRSIPVVLTVALLFYIISKRRLFLAIMGLCLVGSLVTVFWVHDNFVYSVIYLNFAVTLLVIFQMLRGKLKPSNDVIRSLLTAFLFGVVIQYLAGYNYAGVIYAYMGSGLLLSVAYLFFRDLSPSLNRRKIAPAMLAVILAIGLFYKYMYVYRDEPRWKLNTEFRTEKLQGIKSTQRNVSQMDGLVAAVKEVTNPGDYIFIFPDFPILYYLTDRRNPTPIGWYVQIEYGGPMTIQALKALIKHKPKVIFVQTYFELDYKHQVTLINYRQISRYRPFIEFIASNYRLEGQIGDIYMFVPKG